MIELSNLTAIGKLIKTHGIKGEMSMQLYKPVDLSSIPYMVCEIDGILVPFFIEEVRSKTGSTVLIKFENIHSDMEAKELTGADVFVFRSMIDEGTGDELIWESFVGFTLRDEKSGMSGKIIEVEDSTSNVLFCVSDEAGKELLIPANEDLIVEIDPEKKVIRVDIPEGLMDLN
ncbi:MAG: ribosome maturation factor RimM [Candidatus Azobacteroides sp.]|nr:ribosome maturation factor RimM [Candidatus Azobacteroides sp.]